MSPSELSGFNKMVHRHKTSDLWEEVVRLKATQTLISVTELRDVLKRYWKENVTMDTDTPYQIKVLRLSAPKPAQPGERNIEASWGMSNCTDASLKLNFS